jgi:predicted DNA-binding transcriptional regulator AlpA
MSESRQSAGEGIFGGSRIGFFEHEIDSWIWSRVRVADGAPGRETAPLPDHPRIISMREVERRTGFTRIHIWRLEKLGKFPRRLRLSDPAATTDDIA